MQILKCGYKQRATRVLPLVSPSLSLSPSFLSINFFHRKSWTRTRTQKFVRRALQIMENMSLSQGGPPSQPVNPHVHSQPTSNTKGTVVVSWLLAWSSVACRSARRMSSALFLLDKICMSSCMRVDLRGQVFGWAKDSLKSPSRTSARRGLVGGAGKGREKEQN